MAYGSLEVICGPMFSGKSTRLLRSALCASALEGRRILVLKPAFDTRYAAGKVVSHDGLSLDALVIAEWPEIHSDVQAVFIDEVQFLCDPHFKGDVVAEVRLLLERGVDVVVAGLSANWRGEPFEVTARLMAMADKVKKRVATCPICGRSATKTFKKVRNDKVAELGESDLYEARCNQHWHC